jgi:hypothetical protein
VVLPPIVGSDASLNLAVALVAASGGGKSGATACADDLLHVTPYRLADVIDPGSGEGVMMAFLEWDADEKRNRLKSHAHALMHADEIGQIGAVQGRASQSSLGSILRSMLTGDRVGTTAADTTKPAKTPTTKTYKQSNPHPTTHTHHPHTPPKLEVINGEDDGTD